MKTIFILLTLTSWAHAQRIGAVVGWKTNHASGIETRGDDVVTWPAALGEKPTAEELAAWTDEYRAAMAEKKTAEINRGAVAAWCSWSFVDLTITARQSGLKAEDPALADLETYRDELWAAYLAAREKKGSSQ